MLRNVTERLEEWRERGLERTPWEFSTGQLPRARIDGEELLLFSSSNYLGLSTHPRVKAAACAALELYGTGSGGSRLTTGSTALHHEIENQIADWFGYESAVYFATGYQANVGLISALCGVETTVFSDEKNHASIIDGCRLSKAQVNVYPHRDLDELERALCQRSTERALVVTDGLFSMDGTVADVAAIIDVAHRHGAWVAVDEAHGVGTIGSSGRGSWELGGIRPDILIGTASKALGSEGGFVCCAEPVATLLRNQSRSYVYSTANAALILAATGEALCVLDDEPDIFQALCSNVRRLRENIGVPGDGPIIPVRIGNEDSAMWASKELRHRGFHVPAIRYPTVPRGKAMLRVTVMATHTKKHIDLLSDAIQEMKAILALVD